MRIRLAEARDDRAVELLAALGDEAARAGAEIAPTEGEGDVTLFAPLVDTTRVLPDGIDPRRAIAVCAQYPGNAAFDAATLAAAAVGGALALSELAMLEQRRRGVDARHLRLGLAARWRAPAGGPTSDRERDVIFIGAHSPRRERLLACNAASLEALRAEIRLGSVWPGSRPLPTGRARRELLTSSSVVLDIHSHRPDGLDRVLALEAIGAGALLLTEHAPDLEPFVAGTHLETADGGQLGLLAGDLADDPARLDAMVAAARDLAAAELSPRPGVELLLGVAETVAHRAQRHDRWRLGRRRGGRATGVATRSPVAASTPLDPAPGARRKSAVLSTLERRGRERARQLGASGLDSELRCVFESPAWQSRPARSVAVCIPVHDDGDLALEALETAARALAVDVELLVADDASADDSRAQVEHWLDERPHIPARLLASALNRGVGGARNALLAHADAPLAFMLDADNLLFPRGLARLVAALDAAPNAAFAYGLVERSRGGSPAGLLSTSPWEPERLRDGNFIDAMALLRREHVLAIGGFGEDRRLYGWEDFDLWCRLAEAGAEAAFVPQFIGRYREREGSMLSIAEIDTTDAVALLRERSPRLSPSIPAAERR